MKRLTLILGLLLCALPAQADVKSEAGSFLTGTGTAAIEVNLAGAFQPICVIFWTTMNGLGTTNTHANSMGAMCDEATDRQRAIFSGCAEVDPSDCNQIMSETQMAVLSGGTAATECSVVLTSFDADGFTVTPDDACTSDSRIFYLAIGGTSITNVSLHTVTLPAATGNFTTTTPGFQPDFLFLFGTTNLATGSYADHAGLSVGFTNGVNAALYSSFASDAQNTSVTSKYVRSAAAQLEVYATTASAVNTQMSFVQWETTGYTINRVEGTAQYKMFALAIKGGTWDVGDFLTQSSGTGNFTETHASLTGKGLFALHSNNATAQSTSDTASANVSHSVGFASSATARGTGWSGAGNGATGNDTYDNVQATDQLGLRYNTTPAITQSFDFVSFTNATTVTFNQTDADVAQVFNIYFILGEATASAAKVVIVQ